MEKLKRMAECEDIGAFYVWALGVLLVQALAATDQRWTVHPKMEELKRMAQSEGLWNFWISKELAAGFKHLLPANPQGVDRFLLGKGLTNLVRTQRA